MYTQFFGNYLLSNGYVTQEQLFSAMQKQSDAHMKLGTLAIHAGYMTASEVDSTCLQQTRQDKKFGELAIELGYLTNEQVIELLKSQSPDFLLLGQILVDENILSNSDLENVIADYRSQNELIDLDMTQDSHANIVKLLDNFFITSETPLTQNGQMYLELLFNNFIRFIGEDFTPLNTTQCEAFPIEICVRQRVLGEYEISSYINMTEETAIAFASRYAGETFTEFNEYVRAAMEDFLNLHNGLFIVNVSNATSVELTITAPEQVENPVLDFNHNTYQFPVLYPFGMVQILLEDVKTH